MGGSGSGKHKDIEPTARDAEILSAIRWGHSQSEVGRTYGVSRQRIHQIKNRWPSLCIRDIPPIKKGRKDEFNARG